MKNKQSRKQNFKQLGQICWKQQGAALRAHGASKQAESKIAYFNKKKKKVTGICFYLNVN